MNTVSSVQATLAPTTAPSKRIEDIGLNAKTVVSAVSSITKEPVVIPGQTLENPVTGERFTFRETAATTNGELLAFDFALRPGGAVPFPHVHPIQEERFELIAGRMRFRQGLRTFVAEPGDVVVIPPGVLHAFANVGDEEARLRIEVRPALAMERMFAEVVRLAQAGRMGRRGLPRNPFVFAQLARTFDQEAHAPLLSAPVQRALLAPLLFLARHDPFAAPTANLSNSQQHADNGCPSRSWRAGTVDDRRPARADAAQVAAP